MQADPAGISSDLGTLVHPVLPLLPLDIEFYRVHGHPAYGFEEVSPRPKGKSPKVPLDHIPVVLSQIPRRKPLDMLDYGRYTVFATICKEHVYMIRSELDCPDPYAHFLQLHPYNRFDQLPHMPIIENSPSVFRRQLDVIVRPTYTMPRALELVHFSRLHKLDYTLR